MKTLQTLTAVLLMIFSGTAFAAGEPSNNLKVSMNNAVKTYVDAITFGKLQGLPEILDKDVKFTIAANEKINNFHKREMLDFLKSSENIKQNCTTSYEVLDMNTSQAVIKVILKYENFDKVNMINMAYNGKSWKITNVATSFIQ